MTPLQCKKPMFTVSKSQKCLIRHKLSMCGAPLFPLPLHDEHCVILPHAGHCRPAPHAVTTTTSNLLMLLVLHDRRDVTLPSAERAAAAAPCTGGAASKVAATAAAEAH